MTGEEKSSLTLAPAEWEVMKVLWDHEAMAARDVHAALPPERQWAAKTVKTLLSRLVAKGAVEYDQVGNSYLYRPAVGRERMMRQEVRSVYERIMSEALSPVLAHFLEEAELTDKEIRELKRILDKKRQRKKHSTGKRRRRP